MFVEDLLEMGEGAYDINLVVQFLQDRNYDLEFDCGNNIALCNIICTQNITQANEESRENLEEICVSN